MRVPLENSAALAAEKSTEPTLARVKNHKEKFASASASKRSVTVRCVKDAGNTWAAIGNWAPEASGRATMAPIDDSPAPFRPILLPVSKRQCAN